MVTCRQLGSETLITLQPNCSASRRQNLVVLAVVAGVTFSVALFWGFFGAWMVLPFAGLSLKEKNQDYLEILNTMVNYDFNEQPRLKDGTLCRPEPEKWTVWADDLFMSVPLFLRMGKITGDKKYFDDAAKS